MEEDEDDLYGSNEQVPSQGSIAQGQRNGTALIKVEDLEEEEEEGEEIEEDSDSDIDIITERKPTARPEPLTQPPRQETIKAEVSQATSNERSASRVLPATALKAETPGRSTPSQPLKPGSQYPEVHTSTVDVNIIPTYEPVGKPITDVDLDVDLAEHDKPWRRPGADQSEYFNYGFDEFTWATYCMKQQSMRETISAQKAESTKFEMMFGGAPGIAGMGLSGQVPPVGGLPSQGQQLQQQSVTPGQPPMMDQSMGGMQGMPGMPEMSPDMMNAMMQQMMQSGVDPGQMDFGTFMQQFQQMQGGAATTGLPQPVAFGGQLQGGYGGGAGGGGGGGRKGRRW